MFCPSCGAENKDRDQRYCRECGAVLPVGEQRTQAVQRMGGGKGILPAGSGQNQSLSLINGTSLKNKLIVGAIGLAVLVVALNVLIHLVIATITAVLLPLSVLLAIGLFGYFWLRGTGRR